MLFSIITITKGNPDGFARTRTSIATQSFKDFEWVVVDGDVEPDGGIYDAMNKGIARSSGKYMMFMNAGDVFANDDVLARIATYSGFDVLYGDAIEGGYVKPAHHSIAYGMPTHHQAMVFKRRGLQYDTAYRIAADYKFVVQSMIGQRVRYVHFPICVFEQGGVSQRHAALGRFEQKMIRRELNIHAPYAPLVQFASCMVKKTMPAFYWTVRRRLMTSRA